MTGGFNIKKKEQKKKTIWRPTGYTGWVSDRRTCVLDYSFWTKQKMVFLNFLNLKCFSDHRLDVTIAYICVGTGVMGI